MIDELEADISRMIKIRRKRAEFGVWEWYNEKHADDESRYGQSGVDMTGIPYKGNEVAYRREYSRQSRLLAKANVA